jgi:pyruvate dehydrogenase E2 component (dihydrolipoamide acetyltransferase)
MPFEFKLPDIGEGVHEGEIVKWLIKEGDFVKEDQPMVEVMTDKATVEIPAPRAGKILKLNGKEGEVVKVGSVLVVIEEAGAAPKTEPKREPVSKPAQPTPVATATATAPAPARVLATPATRKLARELGVELTQVQGTGPAGRITDQDVRQFAEARTAAPTAPAPRPTPAPKPTAPAYTPSPLSTDRREERVPLRGIRKRMSERMHQSKRTAAHFTYVDEVDVTELVAFREQMRSLVEQKGVKLTYLPFIVKACVSALKEMPILNASLDESKGEIVLKKYYNIGIAAAVEDGLVVPVVHDADRKNLLEIASEIQRLADTARQGKLAPTDIQGSTFTITSLGALGGLFATPIINYPEVAILGVHEIKKRPVVRDNQIVIRDIMLLSLSFDHRIVDGYTGATFCQKVKRYLEDPKLLLLELV